MGVLILVLVLRISLNATSASNTGRTTRQSE